jgi:hypothetical protein
MPISRMRAEQEAEKRAKPYVVKVGGVIVSRWGTKEEMDAEVARLNAGKQVRSATAPSTNADWQEHLTHWVKRFDKATHDERAE